MQKGSHRRRGDHMDFVRASILKRRVAAGNLRKKSDASKCDFRAGYMGLVRSKLGLPPEQRRFRVRGAQTLGLADLVAGGYRYVVTVGDSIARRTV